MPESVLRSRYAFSLAAPRERPSPLGVVASALLHVLLVALLFLSVRHDVARVLGSGDPDRAPGGGGGGGGGGGRVAYITLPAPAATPRVSVAVTPPVSTPPPVQVPPPPAPEVPPPEVQPTPAPEPAAAIPVATADSGAAAGTGPGTGGGAGGGTGGGIGPGTGPGVGPGEGGGGAGGSGRPPRLRQENIIPHDDAPKELRGHEIRATITVDEAGMPRAVTFDPPLRSGRYTSKVRETLLGFRFYPALGPDGRPVASTFVYNITVF